MRRPSTAVPGIDTEQVTRWMAGRLPIHGRLAFAAVGHGRSNLTYRVTDEHDGRWVLRRPPLGPLLPSAHDVVREHLIISRLAAAGAPVPGAVDVCEDTAVTGAPFYVMNHVDGIVLHRRDIVEELDEGARRASMLSLVEGLAAVQALDVDAIGLGDLGPRKAYGLRQLRRWRKQWEASKTRDVLAVDATADRLEAMVPEQHEVVLVHGDFRIDNAIVSRSGRLEAILDWELSALGDPLADVGAWLAFTPRSESEAIPIHDNVTLLSGFPGHQELLEAYVAATNRDLTELPFWYALSLWKLAIILQGVYRRWKEDPRNGGAGAGELEPVVEWLAARAELAAREGFVEHR